MARAAAAAAAAAVVVVRAVVAAAVGVVVREEAEAAVAGKEVVGPEDGRARPETLQVEDGETHRRAEASRRVFIGQRMGGS